MGFVFPIVLGNDLPQAQYIVLECLTTNANKIWIGYCLVNCGQPRQRSQLAVNRRIQWNQTPPNLADYDPDCMGNVFQVNPEENGVTKGSSGTKVKDGKETNPKSGGAGGSAQLFTPKQRTTTTTPPSSCQNGQGLGLMIHPWRNLLSYDI